VVADHQSAVAAEPGPASAATVCDIVGSWPTRSRWPVSGGTVRLPPCHPARPILILDTHGTADPSVRYDGRDRAHLGRVMTVMAGWARRNGCGPRPARRRATRFVIRFSWRHCRNGVRVEQLRIVGGRHAWPPLGGPPGIELDGAREIWRWFTSGNAP